ncbi:MULTISPECIES: hypothetical protein [unclassified Microbacterium]|uniref:hypothetical protein n=1 Tax=unclassified Microbacterium TaxID=2609290 RepID=UPI00386E22A5
MTDARTGAIRRNTEALNRLAAAQEAVAAEMRTANMLVAAQFSANGWVTSKRYSQALHSEAIARIGVRP